MKKSFAFLILFLVLHCFSYCQTVGDVTSLNSWKGFKRTNIKIAGHSAYYIQPATPLKGNPWVWRASFPEWHTDIDSILVTKGFYVAYINVDNEYGSPHAMQVWDLFYDYLIDSVLLSSRVALEAVSRGALYAYGWAKRNPGKISCIYAEAPVCDFKSWPGGKGKSAGDSSSWRQLLQVFNLTEKDALSFDDNPIDNLAGLAAFRVPLLHIVGAGDSLVPSAENSDILIKRYLALGGPANIYSVVNGPMELHNHHFPIEFPGQWADFILTNSYPVKSILSPAHYLKIRDGLRLQNDGKKFKRVAFLGGSITYNPGWRDKVCMYLEEKFPAIKFQFIAAGIPSLGSLPHAFRIQRDLLDAGKIDLLFIEAAVNDRANATDSLTQVQSLEGIIRHAKKTNPKMDIIMMSFADPAKTGDYDNGSIPVEVSNHELIAEHYHLPSINLALEVHDKLIQKEFDWQQDFKDLHPSPFGQEIYFEAIKTLFRLCFVQHSPGKNSLILPAALNAASFTKGGYRSVQMAKFQKGWRLVHDWTPADSMPTREGFVHVPMLVADKSEASLSFPFFGNAVGIAIVSGPDAGIIRYAVDKGSYHTLDLFTQWSGMLHLPWYLILGKGLSNTKHILRITVENKKNPGSQGHACRIVHFLVNGDNGFTTP